MRRGEAAEPVATLAFVTPHGHRTAELRSIAFHRAVAERLEREPELLERARARVDDWLASRGPVHPVYARRWRELLAKPASDVADALVVDEEEMRDLRQTTPFAGALTPTERWRIVREVR